MFRRRYNHVSQPQGSDAGGCGLVESVRFHDLYLNAWYGMLQLGWFRIGLSCLTVPDRVVRSKIALACQPHLLNRESKSWGLGVADAFGFSAGHV